MISNPWRPITSYISVKKDVVPWISQKGKVITIFPEKSIPQSPPKNPSYIFLSFARSCFTRSRVIESFCMISPRYPSLTMWNWEFLNLVRRVSSRVAFPSLLASVSNTFDAKSVKSLLGTPQTARMRSCHTFSSRINSQRLFSAECTMRDEKSLPKISIVPILAASMSTVPRPQNGS